MDSAAVGRCVQHYFEAFWSMFAAAGTARYEHSDGVTWYSTGVPAAPLNATVVTDLAEERVKDAVKRVTSHFRARGLPFMWRTDGATQPASLGHSLLQCGFHPYSRMTDMTLALPGNRLQISAGLPAVEEVEGLAALERWAATYSMSIEAPPALGLFLIALHQNLRWGPCERWRLFLALVDGRPAGTSGLFIDGHVASIWTVSAHPDLRGHGVGRAATLAAINAGIDSGCTLSVLRSTDMGLPLYTALGYRVSGNYMQYAWQP